MDLNELKNKKILLFGKPRAFDEEEFSAQLSQHKIECVTRYEEDVALIIEGRMMSPYEQNESEALYEKKVAAFESIDALEKALVEQIKEDTLMMSLKLSRDKTRLLSFLKNTIISDTLFLKLLGMYDWSKEDFFENDSNRDVCAALIRRFYHNIERNHNVEYATLGLMHLISQTNNSELIEAIFKLEPLQKELEKKEVDSKFSILEAMVRNPATPKSILESLIKKAPTTLLVSIALREDCDALMQEALLRKEDEKIKEALSLSRTLDTKIITSFLEKGEAKYLANIAKNIQLTPMLFGMLEEYEEALAYNSSLDAEMQKRLFASKQQKVWRALAANSALEQELFEKLLQEGDSEVKMALFANASAPKELLAQAYEDESYHLSLASNSATSQELLALLAQSQNKEILIALAQNTNTPVETLYQLQLDSHLQKYVKENPSFGAHIQSQNIGWMV
ncbi:MAG: hypothetical protein RBR54_02070 [Sulfurimonas sp.]|jgi:hypothetical protein|nr:hypothetical protein [Sulfurimonas sp.]